MLRLSSYSMIRVIIFSLLAKFGGHRHQNKAGRAFQSDKPSLQCVFDNRDFRRENRDGCARHLALLVFVKMREVSRMTNLTLTGHGLVFLGVCFKRFQISWPYIFNKICPRWFSDSFLSFNSLTGTEKA